jgi:hypothetical protein
VSAPFGTIEEIMIWICPRCAAHVKLDETACPVCSASRSERSASQHSPAPAHDAGCEDLDVLVPERKKPIAWLPSFGDRSIIKGARLFHFGTQVAGLLIIAVMVLAVLAAMGISTPASNGLAIFFALIVWMWFMGLLIWFMFGSLMRKIAGTTQPQTDNDDVEDTLAKEVSSLDFSNSYSIQAESDDVQLAPESLKNELDTKSEDTGT